MDAQIPGRPPGRLQQRADLIERVPCHSCVTTAVCPDSRLTGYPDSGHYQPDGEGAARCGRPASGTTLSAMDGTGLK